MDRFVRIYTLDRLLRQARLPLSTDTLMERMECSRATLFRAMEDLRNHLNAPLVYDRVRNGYYYDHHSGEHQYELPGLWFNSSELYALFVIQHLLTGLQPGLLERHLAPLRTRIEEILRSEHLNSDELISRVRILGMGTRPAGEYFPTSADALMRRRQIHIDYHGRERNTVSKRIVSPQRLVHYRDNWYLDAWCHQKNGLRSFAIDRIRKCRILDKAAEDIDQETLDAYYTGAYGIFSGAPKHTAILHFSARAARWVADEHWHPAQKGHFLVGGGYELHVPYGDPRELIMDILRYGNDAEVVSPRSLRSEVIRRLQQALDRYAPDAPGG